MSQPASLRFAHTVQCLGAAARSLSLVVPGFRSPPRLVGVQRSIKRGPGAPTVAVVLRGRPWPAVQADLIEGIVAANSLVAPAADRARATLWEALERAEGLAERQPRRSRPAPRRSRAEPQPTRSHRESAEPRTQRPAPVEVEAARRVQPEAA